MKFHVTFVDIGSIDEKTQVRFSPGVTFSYYFIPKFFFQTFEAVVFVAQTWKDPRIRFPRVRDNRVKT